MWVREGATGPRERPDHRHRRCRRHASHPLVLLPRLALLIIASGLETVNSCGPAQLARAQRNARSIRGAAIRLRRKLSCLRNSKLSNPDQSSTMPVAQAAQRDALETHAPATVGTGAREACRYTIAFGDLVDDIEGEVVQ
jgi:hypothetical protein